jgi:hypothetical protein
VQAKFTCIKSEQVVLKRLRVRGHVRSVDLEYLKNGWSVLIIPDLKRLLTWL